MRNEQTGPTIRMIAGRVLQRGFAWPHEAKAMAASLLTQSPDRKPGGSPPAKL